MTIPNGSNTSTASSIESLDASARQLYRRARTAGHAFAEIATVVRGLHTILKHLRVEAEDPDSLLNTSPTGDNRNSLYARQLAPIVEDCDFTLKQLETILEKYGGSGDSDTETSHADGGRRAGGRRSKEVEDREKDMIALIRTKLANQKTNIDIFLDTVQLHNPVKARRALQNTDGEQLDAIKDQVDEIATKLFHNRRDAAGGGDDDEELWQQFSTELEKAGFSSEVLRNNKVTHVPIFSGRRMGLTIVPTGGPEGVHTRARLSRRARERGPALGPRPAGQRSGGAAAATAADENHPGFVLGSRAREPKRELSPL